MVKMTKEEFLKKCEEMYDEAGGNFGKISDGYHTFDELYYHRAILFAAIVRLIPRYAWKSRMHDDGSMYDGMFIVGIETPLGSATYHYEMELWDEFQCKEMRTAPPFDGHTPDDAIRRIRLFARFASGCLDVNEEKLRSVFAIETDVVHWDYIGTGYKH